MNPTEIPATVVGNLTSDPELRFTSSGRAVANFSVAVNERKLINGEWTDGETLYVPVTAWENLAENVVETLSQGMPVMVYGRWLVDRWEDRKTGAKRERMRVDAVAVGPNLRWSVASVRRPEPHRPQTRWSGQDEAESMIKDAETSQDDADQTGTDQSKTQKTTRKRTTKKAAASSRG